MTFTEKEKLLNKLSQNYPYGIPARIFEEQASEDSRLSLATPDYQYCLVVPDLSDSFWKLASGELLDKMIKNAFPCSLEDILIVSSWSEARQVRRLTIIFSEKVSKEVAEKNGVQAHLNSVKSFSKQQLLFTESLEKLAQDANRKQQFWQILKQYV